MRSLRVFLSFWAEPTPTPDPLLANRSVFVYLKHSPFVDEMQTLPLRASLYMIDDESVNPAATWEAMGKPDKPNASELALLMAASQVRVQTDVAISRVNATTMSVRVLMVPNSVAVIELL